ncbi:AraC family transcriptional regulator [Paenibacillus pasadenensis]|uniref:helix-turn-helix domain-containing protein n=1 Tax=Paenibacillus pasadenensis TaxID=217090 RepID=UPI00203EAFBA|nr:helix-turn-helix domain-containing protein [Paenibacillus pasadenensis]MCM3750277.1 AraC family transcriptional regulator [Paenibacillus pasadenensis]
MNKTIDQQISPLPIRLVELLVDRSRLSLQSLIIPRMGHLPGRISRRSDSIFNDVALAYIADGSGTYQVNDEPIQKVEKGSLFFVWPGSKFNYGPLEGGSWEEYYVDMIGSRVAEFEERGLVQKGKVLQVGADPAWIRKLETLASLLESGVPANADRAALQLESLLFELSLMTDTNSHKSSKNLDVIDDLAQLLYDPIDAEAIARRHNISVSTLRRLVKEHSGYPLNEYFHRLKINEAKKLIVNTTSSIKEIALALQYTDVYYFSRLFTKYAGMSAKKFRDSI